MGGGGGRRRGRRGEGCGRGVEGEEREGEGRGGRGEWVSKWRKGRECSGSRDGCVPSLALTPGFFVKKTSSS